MAQLNTITIGDLPSNAELMPRTTWVLRGATALVVGLGLWLVISYALELKGSR